MQDLKDVTHDVHYENYRWFDKTFLQKYFYGLDPSSFENITYLFLFSGYNVYQILLNCSSMVVVED